ncbi:MAG: hypothetical protein K5790_03080 [Nitrosopumilus sp.]|uniref:hypothetical protein n=1 Tax=Nitrosopumilus sp. TaxID=2024843 RepID=UPI00247BE63D|nr:hypothetical protein [Nitrosopumilus sp.]MCV0392260.1 hypothetical protein [Nitrosopumilus sp.]
MTKLSLTVIAIMSLSVMMIGSSMTSVDAAKQSTGPVVDPECAETDGGFCNVVYSSLCGIQSISGKVSFINTLTTWDGQNEKYKLVTEAVGTLYETGTGFSTPIGYIDDSTTTQGFYEGKGAQVVKQVLSVDCVNGEKDTVEKMVLVDNPGKKK